jgi:hypothetical protein
MNNKSNFIKYIITACFVLLSVGINATEIWVSPKGDNKNPGTELKPLATLDMAIRKARELRRLSDPAVKNGIHIFLKGGIYELQDPVFIRPEDAGTLASPTIIQNAKNEKPVLSGGILVKGWKKASSKVEGLPAIAKGKVWVADAPQMADNIVDFRQLWVDDKKAIRSMSTAEGEMDRILSWNHQEETCWIPKPKLKDFKYQPGMELFIHQWWAIANLRIKNIQTKGDSLKLSFYQPESKIQSEHPWPAPWQSKETGNSGFYLSNSIQFLDQAGEWYLDKVNRKIYYWPLEDENLAKANVRIPYLENLVKIEGTIDQPVSHVHFKGITFSHSTFNRPSQKGHVPLQAGMYLLDAYKLKTPGTPDKAGLENQGWIGRPRAAVEVNFSDHTSFEDCAFTQLGSTGLDYQKGNHNDLIQGNLFKDIGGTAINVGVFSDEAFETHLPYNPKDTREVSSNTTIANNLITNVTNEDWGCVGIGAGYVKNIQIRHNEINEISYSGISLGWGWTRTINAMSNNHVYANKITHYAKHMYDVAGVYTLSAQPGSSITENVVDSIYKAPFAHILDHWFYFYTDEGTSYFNVKNNWCPAEKFLQNANGPGNVWENNGPMVSEEIKQKAGLQTKYQYLRKHKELPDDRWEFNKSN